MNIYDFAASEDGYDKGKKSAHSYASDSPMSLFTLLLRSLSFHWRSQAAVALGVAAATAVLTGALLVGDSMTGSLRSLAIDRLGRIDEVLVSDHFFREELAQELSARPEFQEHFSDAVPAVAMLRATVEKPPSFEEVESEDPSAEPEQVETPRRISGGVFLVGIDERFWKLGDAPEALTPTGDQIVLNAALASQLEAKVGDRVVAKLTKASNIPSDSPLGRKADETIEIIANLEVIEIVPAEGLGRFSLRSNQQLPLTAFLPLRRMQEALEQEGKVNALLVAGEDAATPPSDAAQTALTAAFQPTLKDLGLELKRVERGWTNPDAGQAAIAYEYYSLSSRRMILEEDADKAIQAAFAKRQPQPALTYLANTIARVKREGEAWATLAEVPYSTITAIDSNAPLGPLAEKPGEPPVSLAEDEIALNAWTAEDLGAEVGDSIAVSYFEPESTHGQARETTRVFTLAKIVPLTEPKDGYTRNAPAEYDQRPTLANDPDLTPIVPGLTDAETIADWDAPFPYDQNRIRPEDDAYWDLYRTTPKAFVSLAAGRAMWGSRFGQTTSYRIPAEAGLTVEQLESELVAELQRRDETLHLDFLPVKANALQAAAGTTPFSVLFLGFSQFIIAAALLLVALLFRLGVEQRASEIGLLLAQGFTRRQTLGLLLCEGAIVSALGALLGLALAIGYAWLMLVGLKTLWVDAIVTPFLELHIAPLSLLIGWALGVLVSLATIAVTLWRMSNVSIRSLMSGVASDDGGFVGDVSTWPVLVGGLLLLFAAGLGVAALSLAGEAQAGAFMGSGFLILAGFLLLTWQWLRSSVAHGGSTALSVASLAVRNAGRNSGRSALTIALVGVASFLIIAISAFRLKPTDTGVGGFDFLAESDQPLYADLRDEIDLEDLGFLGEQNALLREESEIYACRLQGGDDASCLNLYQPSAPRAIGLTDGWISQFDPDTSSSPDDAPRSGFEFAASTAQSPAEQANPWRLLQQPPDKSGAIPVILDKNTAMYSLHLYGGVGETFEAEYDDGLVRRYQVVGLLGNSVLQGSLLMSEANLVRTFPDNSGYRFFFIRTPANAPRREEVAGLLEDRLSDYGFDLTDSRERLRNLLAVQNTYLTTFQSLGALGLLLGTFGLAVVQMRNVLERRGELALMRAAGFRSSLLAGIVLLENALLLLGGLAIGVLSATAAVLPFYLVGGASVPVDILAILLGVVLIVGLASGLLAVRAMLSVPILPALRGS